MHTKNILTIMAALLLPGLVLSAGELEINPQLPQQGNTVNVKYMPDERFAVNSSLQAIVYCFAEGASQPQARTIDLELDRFNKVYRGHLVLAPTTVFGLIKVTDGTLVDDNKRQYWHFLVSEDYSKPVFGAHTRQAVSLMGSMPQNCRPPVNYPGALKALEMEIALYPRNVQAQIGLLSLQFQLKDIKKEDYESRMRALLEQPVSSDREYYGRTISRAWNSLGETAKAQEVQESYIARYPQGEFAQEIAFQELSGLRQPKVFVEKAIEFLKRFPGAEHAARIQTGVVNTHIARQEYAEAEAYLQSVPYPAPLAYNLLASAMSSDTLFDIGKAAEVAEEAVRLARKRDTIFKPGHLTEREWREESDFVLGVTLDTYGVAQYDMDRVDDAIYSFEEALRHLGNRAEAIHYEHLIDIFLERGRHKDAYALASTAIIGSAASNYILEEHPRLFREVFRDRSDYDAELAQMLAAAKQRRLADLREESLHERAASGTLSTLDGRTVNTRDLRGKVLVLDFWATWCGPCKRSMPALDELYKEYKDRNDVEFLVINCWEKTDDRKALVEKFLNDTGYSFPMYLDTDDSLVSGFGVTGIPTKFYIDKNGLLQFKEIGFAGDKEFKQHAADIIDLLSSESFYRQ